MKKILGTVAVLTFVLLQIIGCKTKEVAPTGDAAINDWIVGNMQYWYYWNDKIPANPDKSLSPDKLFDSILYKYDATLRPDGDRFSWINPSAADLTASLSGESKTTGAEFQLYRKANTDELGARILYVFPNTPAAQAGLKRGDVIAKMTIDGTVLTATNYSSILSSGSEIVFTIGTYDATNGFAATTTTKTSKTLVFQEDPIFMDSIYVRNNKKIGYIVYNQFVKEPNGAGNAFYDKKMDGIFAKFKAAGVNELVLDLRYNPGGYLSSALNLASLIGAGISSNKLMYRTEYNKTVSPDITKQYGDKFFTTNFLDKTENLGGSLSRVIILTSKRSASASEMVINALKPYMSVFLIGDVTVGKNVGSITIKDDKNVIKWGMQPIVLKTFNSANQSEFTAGFKPDVSVVESLAQPMVAFGDLKDPLLNEAFFQILGSRPARRGVVEAAEIDRQTVYSTIESKAGGSNMFVELKK
jgi:C-terminal processing protease CtpA/Prc